MASCRLLLHIAAKAVVLLLAWLLAAKPVAKASIPGFGSLPVGAQSWLQSKLIQGFVTATTRLRSLPPLAGQLIDRLQRRRLARGDAAGAARLEALRGWSSYVGLHRGVPALLGDLMRNRGLALEIAEDWARLMERAEASNRGAGWAELLVSERAAVLDWAKRSLRKAKRAFRGGAVSLLLSDLHAEFAADRHFLTDLLAEAAAAGLLPGGWGSGGAAGGGGDPGGGGGWVYEQLTALAQQVLDAARDALFPGAGRRGAAAQRRRRHSGHGRGDSRYADDDYAYNDEEL